MIIGLPWHLPLPALPAPPPAVALFASMWPSLLPFPLSDGGSPQPPKQAQVDAAPRWVNQKAKALGSKKFHGFMVELFKDAILTSVGAAVLHCVSIGVMGIAAIRMVMHARAEVVKRVMGVYIVGRVIGI